MRVSPVNTGENRIPRVSSRRECVLGNYLGTGVAIGYYKGMERQGGQEAADPFEPTRGTEYGAALELKAKREGNNDMSKVRVLVGTRKGAFILTSDGKREKWEISGPHFAGWEIYHLKGSPVDPNRLYASQTSGWFGQKIQRSNDGGKTWEPSEEQVRLRRRPGHAQVV